MTASATLEVPIIDPFDPRITDAEQATWSPLDRAAHQLAMAQRHRHTNVVIRTDDLAVLLKNIADRPIA